MGASLLLHAGVCMPGLGRALRAVLTLAPRVWPEATEYEVLCLPAFTPALCGREAEENATNAKDSASMARLEQLHKQRTQA